MTHEFKLGDAVFIDCNNYGTNYPMRRSVVERVTATQVAAGGIRFFSKNGGREIGGDKWNDRRIYAGTPELIAEQTILRAEHHAMKALKAISTHLSAAKGADAVRIFALLPDELKELAGKTAE